MIKQSRSLLPCRQTPNAKIRLKRLRLSARRGNLETELLLHSYLERLSDQLSLDDQYHQKLDLLEQLLNHNDQTLFYWLLQPSQRSDAVAPPAKKFCALIKEIRQSISNETARYS